MWLFILPSVVYCGFDKDTRKLLPQGKLPLICGTRREVGVWEMVALVPGRTLETVETTEPQQRGEIGRHIGERVSHLCDWTSGPW